MNELTANTRTLEIFPWNENFCTGIEEIDVQHKRLVELLNVLVSHLAFNADTPTLNNVFDELKNYTVVHFSTEERIWREHFKQDPWEAWHRDAHGDFIAKVLEIKQQESEMPMDDVIVEIVRFLTHWLALHIIESDKRMAKVVLALPSGISLQRAKDQANEEMAGSTRVLINTVMGMYDKLANRTVELTREISRRIKAEEELRRIQDQLLRLTNAAVHESQAKSTFLASMSHEIRTPMNAIFGFAQLLADQLREPLHREWVASIRKSGQMLLALINDVLDLSKIEAGKLQLNPQGTDIAELTGEIVALFEPMAEAKRLVLRSEIDETELVPVAIDAHRVRQILMNLISNAVKYTERGEVVVSVAMRPAPLGDGRDLRLTVRDTGTGIAADAQAQIFEPFFQADSPDGRHRQGTGLGLSITRRLVDLMHGNIQLSSRIGEGTTFQVMLPDLSPAIPVAATGAGDGDERADFDRLPPLRILIVDDVEWNIEVARGYLHGSRHVVAVARDGEQAVAMARSFRPDAIMMDLRMPRMNGYRATEAIREHPALRQVRVIAVTASSLVDEHGVHAVSFDGYIRKPYAPTELLNVLLSLFGEAASAETEADAAAPGGGGAQGGATRDVALAEWQAIRAMSLDALRRRMRIREIGEFSKRLDVLAEEIGDAMLVEEARRLHLAVQRFDAHQMKAVLDRLAGDAGEIAQETPEDAQ